MHKTKVAFLSAAFTFSVMDVVSAQSPLQRLFSYDMQDVQVAFLERQIGPAKRVYGQTREYEVDRCPVFVRTDNGSVVSYTLRLSQRCNVSLSPILQREVVAANRITVGLLRAEDIEAGCLRSCGNAADPTVEFFWTGPRSNGMIDVVGTVILAGAAALDASQKWGSVIEREQGLDFLIDAKFDCNRQYGQLGLRLFQNVQINEITVGRGLVDRMVDARQRRCSR
jgi:hypothetical protein